MKRSWKAVLIAGTVFGLFGGAFAGLVVWNAVGQGWRGFIPFAAFAAFAVGAVAWRWISPLKLRWSGAVAGAVAGLASHPLAWYAFIVAAWVSGAKSSLSEPTVNPLEAVPAALFFTAWSWLFTGWLTVPIGAALGYGLSRVLK